MASERFQRHYSRSPAQDAHQPEMRPQFPTINISGIQEPSNQNVVETAETDFDIVGCIESSQGRLAIQSRHPQEYHHPDPSVSYLGSNALFQKHIPYYGPSNWDDGLRINYDLSAEYKIPPLSSPRSHSPAASYSTFGNGPDPQVSATTTATAANTGSETQLDVGSQSPAADSTSKASDGARTSKNARNEAARRYRGNRTIRVQALVERLQAAEQEIHALRCQNERLKGRIDILREAAKSRVGEMEEV